MSQRPLKHGLEPQELPRMTKILLIISIIYYTNYLVNWLYNMLFIY